MMLSIYIAFCGRLFDVKSKSTHLDMWMVGLHEFEQKIEEI